MADSEFDLRYASVIYGSEEKACEPLHVQLDLSNYSVAVGGNDECTTPGLLVLVDVNSAREQVL